MRVSLLISLIAVGLPFLATSFGIHGHARAYRRTLTTKIETVTEIAIVTVTIDEGIAAIMSTTSMSTAINATSIVSAPTTSTPATPTLPSSPAAPDATSSPPLVPIPNSAMLKNSCAYPVYIWSDGHPSCQGKSVKGTRIAPGDMHVESLRKCAEGGVSLKVSKTESVDKPMQFEYSVWEDGSMVSYDISYLDCMEGQDLRGCAGQDGGIQAVGGGDCKKFACAPGQYCDQQAYVVAEFGYLPGAPVGGCEAAKGIAFELCAGERE